MELNCCEICVTGWVNDLVSCRKDAITPMVMLFPTTPDSASAPPTTATRTYSRLPMFIMIGMRMFAKVFALAAFSRSSSLSASNCSLHFSSWQNTLMTFWPLIISSI